MAKIWLKNGLFTITAMFIMIGLILEVLRGRKS